MKIFIKQSEDRFWPMGNVYSTTVETVLELEKINFGLKIDTGKRSNEIFFKMELSDRQWLSFERFIDEYLSEAMPERKLDQLGFEDKTGAIRDLKTMTDEDFEEGKNDNVCGFGFGGSHYTPLR